jgi:uncharacterized protein YjiS (DUF1127 family)
MPTLSLSDTGRPRARQPLLFALLARILRAFEHRRAIDELSRLDDHMLSDIGISRADIERVVVGRRY